jgi:hypothetical protein
MEPSEVHAETRGVAQAVERRKHRRLAIRLPLEYCPKGQGRERPIRAVTANISTGGVYFETDVANGVRHGSLEAPLGDDSLLELELTIPPGEGHFPYEGRVRSVVQVVRRDDLPADASQGRSRRIGVAGRFHEPLKFTF